MEKLENLKGKLQSSIDFAVEHNEDMEASGWGSQEGVLINHNDAKLIVEMIIEKLK